jgi:LacI family transcriptional regulator
MLERHAEGVAVMTFGIEEPLLDQLATRNIPLVFVDLRPDKPMFTALMVDYHRGIREAVQHLAAMGHRDIAFISGPLQMHSAAARQQAFCASMQEIGITVPANRLVEGNHTADGGFDAMQSLMAQPQLATAVMCSNDMTAIGALRALNDKGLRVPQDISVIGFDDIHIAQYTAPPLTTIRMSCVDLAQNAVEALLSHAPGATATSPVTRPIPTNLVVRQTTNYPRTSLQTNGNHTISREGSRS